MYEVSAQGAVLQIKKLPLLAERQEGDTMAKRGRVTRFSRKSRKRLIEMFNRMQYDRKAISFMTLTFHSIPTHEHASNSLRKFLKRLGRHDDHISAIWRKELQRRGAIHYHIMMFNAPFIPQEDLQQWWCECVGEELAIVDIRRVKSRRAALHYVSKYIAKVDDDSGGTSLDTLPYLTAGQEQSTGHWWGVFMRRLLPFAPMVSIYVKNVDALFYLKFAMRTLSHGRCATRTISAMLFSEEALDVFLHFARTQHTIAMETPPTRRLSLGW